MRLAPALLLLATLACASDRSRTEPPALKTLGELQRRIDQAQPGDTILVKNDTYVVDTTITITRSGRADAPIVVLAESIGGVTLTGARGFHVSAPASHVQVIGFVFQHAAGQIQVDWGATHVRFAHNVFELKGEGAYLTIYGDDAEIDHNEFRNKSTLGNMIGVQGNGAQVTQRVHIHDNYFHDFAKMTANGAEAIRLGISTVSMSQSFSTIEDNLFVRCAGENELLSIKSGANTIRYNTFLDSPASQVTLRHGNENLVYGNYLRRTGGIRIYGDRHVVFSNYLEDNTGAIEIGNGDTEVADGGELTGHDRPDDNVVAFNTLVNNLQNFYMRDVPNGLGATGTVFANNVIQGGGFAANLAGQYLRGSWTGNVVWQSAPDMLQGYELIDPRLAADANGVFRPRSDSPLVDSATGSLDMITFDIDGQPRTLRMDRGADEVSTTPVRARILSAAEMLELIRQPDAGQN